jgi:uncharacterized protein
LVGGGILVHGVPALHHAIERWASGWPRWVGAVFPTVADGVVGVLAGALALAAVMLVQRLRRRGA